MGPGPPLGPLQPPSLREGFRHGADIAKGACPPCGPLSPWAKPRLLVPRVPRGRLAGLQVWACSDPVYIWECRQDCAPEPT